MIFTITLVRRLDHTTPTKPPARCDRNFMNCDGKRAVNDAKTAVRFSSEAQIASLSSFEARNATFLLALI